MIAECPLCPQKWTFSYGATSVALGQMADIAQITACLIAEENS
jgi:hypothetical protein